VDAHVELLSKAKQDLKRVGPGPDRKAIIDALTVGLTALPPPDNLNVKALKGAAPWLRLRVGDYRILYRPLSQFELQALEERRRSAIERKKVTELIRQGKLQELTQQGNLEELRRLMDPQRPLEIAEAGFLVSRIVHRRDLDRAVRTLPL
jgi:mRNA-degrading endonuclease RelE of RelBE toxin-antitoxin system